jgi:hypothetical protein
LREIAVATTGSGKDTKMRSALGGGPVPKIPVADLLPSSRRPQQRLLRSELCPSIDCNKPVPDEGRMHVYHVIDRGRVRRGCRFPQTGEVLSRPRHDPQAGFIPGHRVRLRRVGFPSSGIGLDSLTDLLIRTYGSLLTGSGSKGLPDIIRIWSPGWFGSACRVPSPLLARTVSQSVGMGASTFEALLRVIVVGSSKSFS